MKEIETKHGAVKVTCGTDRIYLRTSSFGPIVDPAPELIEGEQVRLSIDEARIIGKAIMRCVAEAEEHVEAQSKIEMRRKALGPRMLVDFDDLPAFTRLDPVSEAARAQKEAAFLQKEREGVERLMAEAKQRKRRCGKPSKAAEQILAGTFADPLKSSKPN